MEYQALLARQKLNGSSYVVADGSVAIGIRYKGTQVSATVTVASGQITCKHGAAGSEAVDSTVGSSGVVDDATYTTIGAMVDVINASPNWHAEIIDGLRSDLSGNTLLARAETTLSPARGQVLPLFWDTSAHLSLSYAISARRLNFNRSHKNLGAQSILKQVTTLVNIGSGALSLKVYQTNATRSEATLLASKVVSDNTDTTLISAAGETYVADPSKELLVRITGSVDLPDSGAYLDVSGEVLA